MASPTPVYSASFFDFAEPIAVIAVDESARETVTTASGCRAPFRAHLGARDDYSFVDDVVAQLEASGFSPKEASEIARAVLLTPTISLKTGERIMQAAIVGAVEGSPSMEFPTQVEISGRLDASGRTKTITEVHVESTMVDLDNESDLAALASKLAERVVAYPMPATTTAFETIVLGKPARGMVVEGASPWNDLLTALGRTMGTQFRLMTNQTDIKQPFSSAVKLVVALDPSFVGVAKKVGKSPLPPVIETDDQTVAQVVGAIAMQVRSRRMALDEAEPETRVRALIPDEQVFHRKVGSSAAFDRFGDPCKPCTHSYVRYHSAPKAAKGMSRLYTNFESSMLHHCAQGYDCGIYAVFAPSNI